MTAWSEVPGFEGLYEVSDDGRVQSMRPQVDREIGCVDSVRDDTPKVLLSTGGGSPRIRHLTVASLVAAAFLGPRPSGHVAFHLDRDKGNCRLNNLVYVPRAMLLLLNHSHPSVREKGERQLEELLAS